MYYEVIDGQEVKMENKVQSRVICIKDRMQGWWQDTCSTVHVFYEKTSFKTYSEVIDGQEGNDQTLYYR